MKQKSGGPTLSPVPGMQLDLTAAVRAGPGQRDPPRFLSCLKSQGKEEEFGRSGLPAAPGQE